MFKAKQLVLLTDPTTKAVLVGYITKYTANSFEIVFEEKHELNGYSNPTGMTPERMIAELKITDYDNRAVPASIEPFLARDKEASVKVQKGDVVSFEHEGKTLTGRVEKGGKRATVFTKDGGLLVPAGLLSPYTPPSMEPALEPWAISSLKDVSGHDDSRPCIATITYHGKPVFKAIDDGWGGGMQFELIKPQGENYIHMLEAVLVQICKDAGVEPTGVLDIWVYWYWTERVRDEEVATFIEYMHRFKKQQDEWTAKYKK